MLLNFCLASPPTTMKNTPKIPCISSLMISPLFLSLSLPIPPQHMLSSNPIVVSYQNFSSRPPHFRCPSTLNQKIVDCVPQSQTSSRVCYHDQKSPFPTYSIPSPHLFVHTPTPQKKPKLPTCPSLRSPPHSSVPTYYEWMRDTGAAGENVLKTGKKIQNAKLAATSIVVITEKRRG